MIFCSLNSTWASLLLLQSKIDYTTVFITYYEMSEQQTLNLSKEYEFLAESRKLSPECLFRVG